MISNYQLKRYNFKIFLEGIEIPFSSMNVSYGTETQLQVRLPPYKEGLDLKPNTYALIVFKRKKTDEEWKCFAEGFLTGKSYSKTPSERTVNLIFKDVKYLYQQTILYNIFNEEMHTFGLTETAFFGDSRVEIESEELRRVGNASFLGRLFFIESFQEDSEQPITDSVEAIFANLLNGNLFIHEYSEKLKLDNKRIKIIENDKTRDIFTYATLENIYEGIFNQAHSTTNVMDLILALGQIIRYDFVPVPGFVNGGENTLNNYLFKPHLQFAAPPACNVIFPDENTSFNYRKNDDEIPTRFRFIDKIAGVDNKGYFAPSELQDIFYDEEERATINYLTESEKFKGVIPHQTVMPFTDTLAITHEEGERKNLEEAKALLTNYMFYESKYQTVPMNIEIAFKEDLLPGFPVLVMDSEMPMMGYISGITLNINPESGFATTSITISHARPFDTKVPALSGWYSKKQFGPNNIGSHVYEPLGTTSAFKNFSDPEVDDEGFVDYSKPIMEIQKAYEEAADRVKFQEQFKRELSTFSSEDEEDMMDLLDMEWEDDRLTGGPLNIELESGIATVSEVRREAVYQLRQRMETTSPRKYSREDDE